MAEKRNRITCKSLQKIIREKVGIDITAATLRKLMTNQMDLVWKRIRHQPEYVNSRQNLELRSQFATNLIGLIHRGKIILNFDESIIDGTSS